MQVIEYPGREAWTQFLKRPSIEKRELEKTVRSILAAVRQGGDAALREFSKKFDGVQLNSLDISPEDLQDVDRQVDTDLQQAIDLARQNIERFHHRQLDKTVKVETMPGVICWRRSVPIERVGLYIPGGTAPLFSSVLMLAIPALIAGCREIVLCTPPDREAKIHPTILYTAKLLGLRKIYRVGGAQAIAAMAYGTESIPQVDKIFGPGNQYVTMAKQIVSSEGVAIDMPAGPSEVAVIADASADPEFVAADLLSQAEHGADSQVILATDSRDLLEKVQQCVRRQLADLPRRKIAEAALANSRLVLLSNPEEALEIVNFYAPEHLILMTANAEEMAQGVINAGSVFIGAYTPEAAGDYASGTNHTLPTNGYARSYSGVSLDSFVKKITFQQIDAAGIRRLGPAIESMARAEELEAHARAVGIRLRSLAKEAS